MHLRVGIVVDKIVYIPLTISIAIFIEYTISVPNVSQSQIFLWGALSLNSGFKAGLDMDQNELVGL